MRCDNSLPSVMHQDQAQHRFEGGNASKVLASSISEWKCSDAQDDCVPHHSILEIGVPSSVIFTSYIVPKTPRPWIRRGTDLSPHVPNSANRRSQADQTVAQELRSGTYGSAVNAGRCIHVGDASLALHLVILTESPELIGQLTHCTDIKSSPPRRL
jgi:hypothetical protein